MAKNISKEGFDDANLALVTSAMNDIEVNSIKFDCLPLLNTQKQIVKATIEHVVKLTANYVATLATDGFDVSAGITGAKLTIITRKQPPKEPPPSPLK